MDSVLQRISIHTKNSQYSACPVLFFLRRYLSCGTRSSSYVDNISSSSTLGRTSTAVVVCECQATSTKVEPSVAPRKVHCSRTPHDSLGTTESQFTADSSKVSAQTSVEEPAEVGNRTG